MESGMIFRVSADPDLPSHFKTFLPKKEDKKQIE
jgi:hypothetical protein